MKYIKSYYLHAEYQIMRLGKQGPRISLFTSKECFLLLILTNIHIKLLQATWVLLWSSKKFQKHTTCRRDLIYKVDN